jgi:hypothetical protein
MKNIISRKVFENTDSVFEYDTLKDEFRKIIGDNGSSFRNANFVKNGIKYFNHTLDDIKVSNFDIEYFMTKFKDEIFKDEYFLSHSAEVDMLLYKYDKSHPLSGDFLKDDVENSPESYENMIKYDYGYHVEELGKRYLYQSYDNLSEFFSACSKEYANYFFEFKFENHKYYNNLTDDVVDKYSEILSEGDYYLVIIDIQSLCDDGYIETSYSSIKDDLDYNNNGEYDIIDGVLYKGFGEPVDISNEKIKKILYNIDIKHKTNKFNL